MYELSRCLKFNISYVEPGKNSMVLSRHRSRERAERALAEMIEFGKEDHKNFKAEYYQIMEIYSKKKALCV